MNIETTPNLNKDTEDSQSQEIVELPIWERKGMTEEQYKEKKEAQIVKIADKLIDRAEEVDGDNILYRYSAPRDRDGRVTYNKFRPAPRRKVVHTREYSTKDKYSHRDVGDDVHSIATSKESKITGKPRKKTIAVELRRHKIVAKEPVSDERGMPYRDREHEFDDITINPRGKSTGREFMQTHGTKAYLQGHDSLHEVTTEEVYRAAARTLRAVKNSLDKKSSKK